MVEATVVIPTRNEAGRIAECLDSVLSNNYPHERLEVLVVDGSSTDGTPDIVRHYAARCLGVRLLPNPEEYTPFALNRGIRAARGSFVLVLGAHAVYPPDYIATLVDHVKRGAGDFVGGGITCVPGSTSPKAIAISIALGSRAGVGLSFRTRRGVEPVAADTAVFGCARRELFLSSGLYDVEFIRAQDLEFCVRLRKTGRSVVLLPWLRARYYARDTYGKLARMLYQYGYWKNKVNKKHRTISSLRQLAPPGLLVVVAASSIGAVMTLPHLNAFYLPSLSYLSFAVVAATIVSASRGKPRLAGWVCWGLIVMHASYGWGYLRGAWDSFVRRRRPPVASLTAPTR